MRPLEASEEDALRENNGGGQHLMDADPLAGQSEQSAALHSIAICVFMYAQSVRIANSQEAVIAVGCELVIT